MAPRIVDLTLPIHSGMPTFPVPWQPSVEVAVLGRHGVENRETRRVTIGTHSGTHVDAPRHFVPGGETVDRLPLEVLVGTALVLDLSRCGPRCEIDAPVLARRMGRRRPRRLVLRFDWDRYWGSATYWNHPFLSGPAAEFLVKKGVRLLAMDTPMPDNPAHGRYGPVDSPNHKLLLGAGVVLVEYLCNLRALRQPVIKLIVMPLRIRDADGAPARCVAIEGSRHGTV